MDSINELELRSLLKRTQTQQELVTSILTRLFDSTLSWEERRPLWFYLYLTGRHAVVAQAMKQALLEKTKIPFELFIEFGDTVKEKPRPVIFEALLKGMKKQGMLTSLFAARGWDKWDARFAKIRAELLALKLEEQRKFKESMLEKFWFLNSQRMTEQAGRTLRRMIDLFPDDEEIKKLKKEFEEQWARDVLSTHMATLQHERSERTVTNPSTADKEMVKCFLEAAQKLSLDNRDTASAAAYAMVFMEEYGAALEILNWAPPSASGDWLRAELLILNRHFVEAMEFLNHLEIKYVEDPETTFAVSFSRARCLKALGQQGPALEILQSIVRVRPSYRSAHALILEWTQGASWE